MLPIEIGTPPRGDNSPKGFFSNPKWQHPLAKFGIGALVIVVLLWSSIFPHEIHEPGATAAATTAAAGSEGSSAEVSVLLSAPAPELEAATGVTGAAVASSMDATTAPVTPVAAKATPIDMDLAAAHASSAGKPVVLVTGVSGMIGSCVAKALVASGKYDVHGLVRYRSKLSNLSGYLDKLTLHFGDITDSTRMRSVVRELQPVYIYHMAAQAINGVSYDSPELTMNTNVMGTLNILEAVKTEMSGPVADTKAAKAKHHVPKCRLLIAGSSTEYGQTADEWDGPLPENAPMKPVSPYGVSKVATEMLAFQYYRSFKIETIVARFFIQVAAGGTEHLAMQEFARQIAMIERGLQKPTLLHGNLQTKRDMTDIGESAGVVVQLAEKGVPGEAYNIGSGEAYKMQDLLDLMIKQAKVKITPELDVSRLRVYDEKSLVVDNTKLKKVTGWVPNPNIERTIKQVLDYWRREVNERYFSVDKDGNAII